MPASTASRSCTTKGGELALQEISRRKPCIKNRIEEHIEKVILWSALIPANTASGKHPYRRSGTQRTFAQAKMLDRLTVTDQSDTARQRTEPQTEQSHAERSGAEA